MWFMIPIQYLFLIGIVADPPIPTLSRVGMNCMSRCVSFIGLALMNVQDHHAICSGMPVKAIMPTSGFNEGFNKPLMLPGCG